MRIVHEAAGSRRVLATDVAVAESTLARTKGLMGRQSVPENFALVFEFDPGLLERAVARLPGPLGARADRRNIHMLFVRTPIDVVWVDDGDVVQVRTLPPWRGMAGASADTVVEMAAGAADGVEPGDRLVVEDADGIDGAENPDADPERNPDTDAGRNPDTDAERSPNA